MFLSAVVARPFKLLRANQWGGIAFLGTCVGTGGVGVCLGRYTHEDVGQLDGARQGMEEGNGIYRLDDDIFV